MRIRGNKRASRVVAWLCACLFVFIEIDAAGQIIDPPEDAGLMRLYREIERLSAGSGGTVGVGIIHLETGRRLSFNGQEPFPMASTYKVPIAVQLLTRADNGEISLEDMVRLAQEDLHPGSGTLARLFDDPGVILSLHNLLELMLLISDNSATDLVLRAAGGPEAVNARMAELGIRGLRVDRPTSLLIGDYLGLKGTPEDGRMTKESFAALYEAVDDTARALARKNFATDPKDTSTPMAMASLLEILWNGGALSTQSTELLLDILTRVETGEGRLKGMLPPGTQVGHKTGTIGGTTNDAGIITLPDEAGHVITVVFVKDSEFEGSEREGVIAQIARAVYDYFLFN